MKITQETDYALRMILYLSKLGMDNRVGAKAIAEHEKIPARFTLKILRKLTHAGLTKAFRGINGGYTLNKDPECVTLREVIEAIDGPICINRCIHDANYCNLKRTSTCQIHHALNEVRKTLWEELDHINFRDLIENKQLEEQAK